MTVTTNDVKKAARLAQIPVEDARLDPLAKELDAIVQWVEQLNDVDVEGVTPMAGVASAQAHLRQDVVSDGGKQAEILANAPNRSM